MRDSREGSRQCRGHNDDYFLCRGHNDDYFLCRGHNDDYFLCRGHNDDYFLSTEIVQWNLSLLMPTASADSQLPTSN